MTSAIQIEKISRVEKLQAMEALWEDLSRTEAEVESPPWHQDALKETEARFAAGQEMVTDWEAAKKALRNRVA